MRSIIGIAGIVTATFLGTLMPAPAACAPLPPSTVVTAPYEAAPPARVEAAPFRKIQASGPVAFQEEITQVDLLKQPLQKGMHGPSIHRLQQGLAHWQPIWVTGTYDDQTEAAVRQFQGDNHLRVDGKVDNKTYAVLWSRTFWEKYAVLDLNEPYFYEILPARVSLRAVLSEHRVHLQDAQSGRIVKTYPFSNGSAKYPTPTGTFTIGQVMEKPTWHPPKSDWAQNAKVMGPGPNNPLGPAALRLGQSSILFHGVPRNEWDSIGHSAQSHGCMRMFPQDAWELHKIVPRGTTVTVE